MDIVSSEKKHCEGRVEVGWTNGRYSPGRSSANRPVHVD